MKKNMSFRGELIIEEIFSIEEALDMPAIATGTPESIEKDIEEQRKMQESLTNSEH